MADIKSLARRGFLSGALVTAGAAVGWAFRKTQNLRRPARQNQSLDKSIFEYDVSEYMQTDPELHIYEAKTEFNVDFERVKSVLMTQDGALVIAGDRSIKGVGQDGTTQFELPLSRPPHCMAISEEGLLWVGLGRFCEVYDLKTLEKKFKTEQFGEKSYITSMQAYEERVYVADAGLREMVVLNAGTGKELFRFGKKTETNPGFNVPSPYFDFVIGRDLKLHISNPGLLRVETYTMDGEFESSWGKPGMTADAFCGCCNPVYLTQLPDGDFVTSEKGLARLHVYSEQGKFKGVVADPNHMIQDEALAKKACGDCTKGHGFDLASDSAGNVFVLDPIKKSIRVFAPSNKLT